MITIGDVKFAETKEEFTNDCVGFAKRNKREIVLKNKKDERIGIINQHSVICKASKMECGKYWYNFADIEELKDLSYRQKQESVSNLVVSTEWRGDSKVNLYK